MDEKVSKILDRLTHWYWSAKIPFQYVDHRGAGIGRVVADSPGAFNITWAKYRENLLGTEQVTYFAVVKVRLERTLINSIPLETYATMYSYEQFKEMYKRIGHSLPHDTRVLLDQAFHEKV